MSVVFDKEKIKQLYPGAEDMMHEPMKIHGSTPEKIKEICSGNDYFAQVKKDGAWYMYCHCDDEHSYLFSRVVSTKTGLLSEKSANVPHIMSVLNSITPEGTCIIGEIYYPNGKSKDTVRVMGSLPERAKEVQKELGLIHFYMHDMLWWDGEDLVSEGVTNYGRYSVLKQWAIQSGITEDVEENECFELADVFEPGDGVDLYQFLQDTLSSGEEGLVFKAYRGKYEPGKRPMTNWKAKQSDGIDAIILGFYPPTKEYTGKELENWQYFDENDHTKPVTKAWYYGWTNSVLCIGLRSKNLVMGMPFRTEVGRVSSGISDEMKKDMTEHPNNYIGKVCEVRCMEKDNKARTLRHPFFVRLRDDKNPDDCILEEVFSDE